MKDHYEKLSNHIIFENKKHHYKNIIEAKKNIDFKQIEYQLNHYTLPQTNHKYQSYRDREIKKDNQLIYEKILSIKNRNPRTKTMPDAHEHNKKTRCTMNNNLYQFEKKTYQDNIKFIKRLSLIKPVIGNREDWTVHQKKTNKLEKQIQRYSKNKNSHEQKQLKEAITEITRRQLKKQGKRYSMISSQIISDLNRSSKQKGRPTAQTKFSVDDNIQNQLNLQRLQRSNSKRKDIKQKTRRVANPKIQKYLKRNRFMKTEMIGNKCETYRSNIYKILLSSSLKNSNGKQQAVTSDKDQNFEKLSQEQKDLVQLQNL